MSSSRSSRDIPPIIQAICDSNPSLCEEALRRHRASDNPKLSDLESPSKMHVPSIVYALLWAVVAFIIFLFVNRVISNRRYAAEARRLGCLPPPGRKSALPFGISFIVLALRADREKRFPNYLMERFEELKCLTLRYSIAGVESYQTCDPKNLQAMLATQFNDFALPTRRLDSFHALLGHGIFTLNGKGWENSRAMLRPQFAREQVSDLDLEERHVRNMMEALPTDSQGWIETDLLPLFFRLTLDSATEFLFGESVDSQIKSLPSYQPPPGSAQRLADEENFATAFDNGQRWIATRSRFQDLWWLVNPREFRVSCKQTHAFVDHFVRLALSQTSSAEKASPRDTDVDADNKKKPKYIFGTALAAQIRDPVELRSQLLNILLAGRDTTASHLGWVFYLLARHPAVFAKLRATIIDTFGTYDAPRDITFARLKSCAYLQQVNNETLRLFPVVPANSRQAVRDTTLPRGGGPNGDSKVFVKKGMNIEYSVHVMHHHKELWGDDAEEFKPERWEKKRVGWEYLPFNGGPRICIGQQFALTEASYVTVRLMQRFEKLESIDTEPVVRHNLSLTNCSGSGVKVRMREARS